jgi:dethiobiotin synthetase
MIPRRLMTYGCRGPVVVTGTDTGVGKTLTTAAVAWAATAAGLRVAVLKPAQAGIEEESDIDTVARLAAPATARELASYPDPLAPAAAARVSGLAPLELGDVVVAVREVQATHDLVLVEGAGGLLVPMGVDCWTVADLACALGGPAIVVARAGLGTLNHTALTLEALWRRRIDCHVVIGAWPRDPELVHRTNVVDLCGTLVGALPDGAGALTPGEFRAGAPTWLGPEVHGHRDMTTWRSSNADTGMLARRAAGSTVVPDGPGGTAGPQSCHP